jgi:Ca-activated chloride channel family protein
MSASVVGEPGTVSGLRVKASGQPIPLEHVQAEAHVVDLAARVTVRQRYRNREAAPIEVVYVFPLDEGAAVCGFEATVDGVRYVGRTMARDEAFEKYDDALESGHGAYLLDEERADVFTASLGNVRPGAEVALTITYVTELTAEGTAARFALPTTVSPRYAPAEDRTGVGPTPAETLNPPVALDVPYAFSFEMDVTMSGAVRGVESPTHPIAVELDGSRARVRLSQRSAPMDRDLVVVIRAEGLDVPHATVERGERGSAVMLSFVPRLATAAQAAEVVFLIDRSGSMDGTSIAEVRNALQLCLRSLTPGCRFNIVSFGSAFSALFDGSVAYGDETLRKASGFVGSLGADMGGTEILPALAHVLSQPPVTGLPRQVLLLTDGEVTNTDEVIALAKRHARDARVFTFGIGAGASQHLVKGIARASGGAAELISPGERIEEKVMRQFARVFAPALTEARVEWGTTGATPASDRIPPLFAGERVAIYALADTVASGTVRLTATSAGQPVTFEIPVDPSRAVEGEAVTVLAARERIRTLEEQGDYLESRGSRQRRSRTGSGATAEIVALGVKYQLCSRETSFVAIEHRETPTEERAELRRVPIALTSGWGGVRERAAHFAMAPTSMPDLPCLAAPSAGARFRVMRVMDVFADGVALPSRPTRLFRSGMAQRPSARPLDRLVALQRADGAWDLTDEFVAAIGLDPGAIDAALKDAGADTETVQQAIATAIALAWLDKHARRAHREWKLLADKARQWLGTCGVAPDGGGTWDALAARLVR